MFEKTYKTNVYVKKIVVEDLLSHTYYRAKEIRTACCACPYYDKVWSCPPSSPVARDLLYGKENGFLIAVQVSYEPYLINTSCSLNKMQKDILRGATYGKVKRVLNSICRQIEKKFDGGIAVAAGVCENCEHCAKQEGLPCRFPCKMRYSFSGIGIDLVKLTKDVFGVDMLWKKNSFPDYEVLVCGIFY